MSKKYDLIVIGGGPAGYVGAIRAAQLGKKVALMEESHIGGCCLNVGCIPTKALFHSAHVLREIKEASKAGITASVQGIHYLDIAKRKDNIVNRLTGGISMLLKKNKVDVYEDRGMIKGPGIVDLIKSGERITADYILIATGSKNALPPIPGISDEGVIDSTKLLSLTDLPDRLVIVGGGVIGCEFAGIFSAFGCKVTVIEMAPRLLPLMDAELSRTVEKQFRKEKIVVKTRAKVVDISGKTGSKKVTYQVGDTEHEAEGDYVLISTGRKPLTEGLFDEEICPEMNQGFICVNNLMESSIPRIYAAGDVTGQGMLAHTAYAGAECAVENMFGANRRLDLSAVPKVVFVDTEIASCGYTEAEAKEAGHEILTGKFFMLGNGKAMSMGRTDGFVKVIADKNTKKVLGLHMAGEEASELITVGVQILSSGLSLHDMETAIYPHPSVSEAIREAALDALGRAIHS